MPKQPQDRLPKKGDAPSEYTFEANGKTYSLPAAEAAANKVSGKFLRDAYLDGDEGEARLAFATLEAAVEDTETLEALYALPAGDMLDHVRAWMEFKPSKEAASLGESGSSSV